MISSFDYAYDSTINRQRVVEASGARVTYAYDNTYQLTRERRSGANAYDTTYTYDSTGNRLLKLDSAARTTYGYDAANQIRFLWDVTGRTTYTFDEAGNQRVELVPAGTRTTNVWDYENRMKVAILPTSRNTYTYAPNNLRVQAEEGATTTKFIWDGQKVVQETNAANATQVTYTQSQGYYGDLVSQRRGATTRWYVFDGLGSTDRLLNNTAGSSDTYFYKAFGEALSATGSTLNDFRFVGKLGYQRTALSNIMYVRARWLNASRGQWLSVDPLGLGDGHSERDYSYADNIPTVHASASGIFARRPVYPLPRRPVFTTQANPVFIGPIDDGSCCLPCECASPPTFEPFGFRYRLLAPPSTPGFSWGFAFLVKGETIGNRSCSLVQSLNRLDFTFRLAPGVPPTRSTTAPIPFDLVCNVQSFGSGGNAQCDQAWTPCNGTISYYDAPGLFQPWPSPAAPGMETRLEALSITVCCNGFTTKKCTQVACHGAAWTEAGPGGTVIFKQWFRCNVVDANGSRQIGRDE